MTTQRVAIMQPYLFPYIGYMNLVAASDIFIFYDDVNYTKKGWINRNRILLNATPFTFTVPLTKPSQNILIKNLIIHSKKDFESAFSAQLTHAYKKCPYFDQGISYVIKVLRNETNSISELASYSVIEFFRMLGLNKQFHRTSGLSHQTKGMEKTDRLITITQNMGSKEYINAIGGMELYNKDYFLSKGVNLGFVKPLLKTYQQCDHPTFFPGLSIIDLLMNLTISEIHEHIVSYQIV